MRVLFAAVTLVFAQSSTCLHGAEPPAEAKPAAPVFRVGFAERDISPRLGLEQPGGYGKAFHRTFHDPCKVRAGVFDDGNSRVVVVSVDALLVRRALVAAARKRIHEKTGIEPAAILIHATHSHSSGPTGMIYPGEYDHADEFVQKLAYVHSSNADLEYVQHVEDQLVAAVVEANEKRSASKCNVGVGQESQVAYNRRFLMKNGLSFTHPRQGNPDIVKPAGPVDPDVAVLGAWDANGTLVGCLVNFTCHATTNPGGVSANYIYYVEQAIRGFFGEQAIVVFIAGASGDVTQVDNLSPYRSPASEQWCKLVGGCVGAEAIKVLLKAEPGLVARVAHAQKLLPIPRRAPNPDRVKKCREMCGKDPKEVGGATAWTFAKEIVLLDAKIQKEPIVDVEVQAIQIGPMVFLSNPAEYFCQMGLDIKAGSPFPVTCIASLSNQCVGYVPTLEAFGEHGGGYETRLTSYSNLDITAGPQIVAACIEMAKGLKPGTIPVPPPAPPFQQNPWEYGSLPPEKE